MKNLLLSMLLLAGSLVFADSGNANIIRWAGDAEETAAEETGHLEVFDRSGPGKSAGSKFADQTAERGKRFLWMPSPDPARGSGGARIPDAILSEDGSALILLETVGSADGPFDTRIVIFDVRTGEIVQVRRLAKIRCTRLLQVPDTQELLLAALQDKNTVTLLRYSPKDDKILVRNQCGTFSDWCIAGQKLLLKDASKRILRVSSLQDLKQEHSCSTRYPGGLLLAGTPDRILNAAPQKTSAKNAASRNPWILEQIELAPGKKSQYQGDRFLNFPEGFQPDAAQICGRKQPLSVWLARGGAAYLLIGRKFHPMADRVTGLSTGHADGTLFLGLQKEDMVGEFHPDDSTRMTRSTKTGGNSPKTRGEVLKIFPDSSANAPGILILDHRAHIYTLQPPVKGRKWKKIILFSPGE